MRIGARTLTVHDPVQQVPFPVMVFYPEHPEAEPSEGEPERELVRMAPGPLQLAMDADVAPGPHRLIVISHGSGGTHLGYRDLAALLALQGAIVAMPKHPGNNIDNNKLEDTPENLSNRPRHISLTLNHIADTAFLARAVDQQGVTLIGHSMGGYTALALAGGRPQTARGQSVNVHPDARVQRLVLMAPATVWYQQPGSLSKVHTPILLYIAERDTVTPAWNAEIVRSGVPVRTLVQLRVVANAGHFSFLSRFPKSKRVPSFAPANDPPGFDRKAFPPVLAAEIWQFIERTAQP